MNPTCVTKGSLYNKCKVCNLEYYESIPAIGHLYTLGRYVVDLEPTCTAVGSKSLHCDVCNAIIDGTEVKIAATGHNYKTPTYSWAADGSSCTATRVCANNSSHKETESGTITSKVKSNPSCGVNGVTTYTATFTNTAFTKQTKDIADIPKTSDHNFSNGRCTICGATCPGKMVIYAVDGPHDMDSACLKQHTDHCDCSSARCIHFDQWDGRATYDAYGKYSVQTGHWCNSMGESGTTRYRKTYFRCTTCGKTSSTTSYCSTKYKSCATGNFIN